MRLNIHNSDTIIALATPTGKGAIGVVRLSGDAAIQIVNQVFKGANLEKAIPNTIHFGTIRDGKKIIDEVLASLFVAPKSYTGENVIEISCHGSQYIIQEIINLFLKNGVRYAEAGEFTRRAFLNGKFDLAQAEAVADLIASDSEMSHKAAMNQMRGGFSQEIAVLREKLIHFASMIELELDFGEEDVEFVDRKDLKILVEELQKIIKALLDSFLLGNVIKNGIPTVIAGKPNAGKSTLLNSLLNEEKAIVSDIAGTTRDLIEDEISIGGINFRFIDTAGLRETTDKVEAIGVERTYAKMKEVSLIIYLFDVLNSSAQELEKEVNYIKNLNIPYLLVANKTDLAEGIIPKEFQSFENVIAISAKQKNSVDLLKEKILATVNLDSFTQGNTIVTNARHYESLGQTQTALNDVLTSLANDITGDFLAMDIRSALHYLSEITGDITTEDLLGNIFSKFCIGK